MTSSGGAEWMSLHSIVVIVGLIVGLITAGCSASKETTDKETPSEDSGAAPAVAQPTPPTPPAEIKTRLFADDVPTESLPLSLSIETLGGASTVLLPRGAPLPTENRQVFSTASDNQSYVEIHLVQGERPLAKDNRSLGKFRLAGIPAAARGVPEIEVTFAVTASGVFEVSAKDLATGKAQGVTVTGAATDVLTRSEVDAMVSEAEATKAKKGPE